MRRRVWVLLGALAVVAAMTTAAGATGWIDFGAFRDAQLNGASPALYGVERPLSASSTSSVDAATATADPRSLVTLARGLKARVVTSGVAAGVLDQGALWPNTRNPKFGIWCNEQSPAEPGLQRINLQTGATETILTGTTACDGVRLAAWGTILFSEEAGGGATGGATYELKDPLTTTGVSLDRATGIFSGGVGAENLVARPALGRLSFEGHGLLANGVMYYGDENRPSSGKAGGAYFKFVPTTPWAGGTLTNLVDSPLAAGKIFGLRVGFRSGATDYGQGTQIGKGVWVPVCDGAACANVDLRTKTADLKLTGYYRPEDLEVDQAALAAGEVKVCGPNTGIEDFGNWGEVLCITDGDVAGSLAGTATPEAQYLVVGNPQLAMPDNIAFQPGRGNWIVHEDGATEVTGRNNDLWDCLPDRADADLLTDGCVRIATINDLPDAATGREGAEWTGGIFDASGKHLYVSVQHNVTGTGVLLDITGWR